MNWMCSEALPMLLFPETLVLGCRSFRSQFEDEIKPSWMSSESLGTLLALLPGALGSLFSTASHCICPIS